MNLVTNEDKLGWLTQHFGEVAFHKNTAFMSGVSIVTSKQAKKFLRDDGLSEASIVLNSFIPREGGEPMTEEETREIHIQEIFDTIVDHGSDKVVMVEGCDDETLDFFRRFYRVDPRTAEVSELLPSSL